MESPAGVGLQLRYSEDAELFAPALCNYTRGTRRAPAVLTSGIHPPLLASAPTRRWCVGAGEATLGKGDLYAKGESLYVENYAY
jgi:hypothetical protein